MKRLAGEFSFPSCIRKESWDTELLLLHSCELFSPSLLCENIREQKIRPSYVVVSVITEFNGKVMPTPSSPLIKKTTPTQAHQQDSRQHVTEEEYESLHIYSHVTLCLSSLVAFYGEHPPKGSPPICKTEKCWDVEAAQLVYDLDPMTWIFHVP